MTGMPKKIIKVKQKQPVMAHVCVESKVKQLVIAMFVWNQQAKQLVIAHVCVELTGCVCRWNICRRQHK
jgi:hypothetical protein